LSDRIAAIRAHPRFVHAVRGTCAANLGLFETATPPERWLLRDVYSASLMVLTIMGDAVNGGVTAASVTAIALGSDTASPNRVRLFVQEAVARGLIGVPPGPEIWTQRPLVLQPALIALWTRMSRAHLAFVDLVMPEMVGISERLAEPEAFRRFWAAMGLTLMAEPGLRVSEPEIAFLHDRNGGARLLQCAAANPTGQPTRVLDRLCMSRTELAASMGVSRPHLNLMLRDAEARGLLEAGRGEVRFSALLSDRYERHHARQFEVTRRVAVAADLMPHL
jgi:hypothetical protein